MLLSALRLTGEGGLDSSVPRYEDRNGRGGGSRVMLRGEVRSLGEPAVDGLESPDGGGEDKSSEGARRDSRMRRVSREWNCGEGAEMTEETG